MPDDANGVYSLPAGYLAVTGTTIQPSQHNPPLEDVATALSARLSRSGAAPMTGPLKATNGSVGAPSYTFNTAQTTGFYQTAGGNIGVSIGGTEVVEFGSGGLVKGGKFVGEIFDYVGSTAPALCVLCYGQTLSRTAYAALWAFAQTEIAAGNTFFNNGDGSTTFGIGDLRGRVRAGRDNMGGSAASRLTSSYFGANASTMGTPGGLEYNVLVTAHLPAHNHGVTDPGHTHSINGTANGQSPSVGTTSQSFNNVVSQGGNTGSAITNISIQNTGSGAAHPNVQPTLIVNACLFAAA